MSFEKWFKRITIKIDWKDKEIFLENENLKVNSLWWKELEVTWYKFKISPEWDIVEYINWNTAWEQLFTFDAAKREALKLWKRLPTKEELISIINVVWSEEFKKKFPGFFYPSNLHEPELDDLSYFSDNGDISLYWIYKDHYDYEDPISAWFFDWISSDVNFYDPDNIYCYSIRCIKEI